MNETPRRLTSQSRTPSKNQARAHPSCWRSLRPFVPSSLRPICRGAPWCAFIYTDLSPARLHTGPLSHDTQQLSQMRVVSASSLTTTILFQVIWSLVAVSAFSFTFSSNPTQCSSLTVNVNGGTAPYRLNLILAGPLPGGGPETRRIVDVAFSDKTFKLDALKFPAYSQFIAMVSDATGKTPSGVIVLCRGTYISS